MKKVWFGILFSVILIPFAVLQVDALVQYGGAQEIEISPGETKTFEWQLKSSQGEGSFVLEMGAYGWGSQFFSYPETLTITDTEASSVEITVTIPSDHPGGVVLGDDEAYSLRATATAQGEEGGATQVNIRASKIVILTILQNEDEQYWSNTAYDEPEKIVEEKVMEVETVEEGKSMEEKEEVVPFSISQPKTEEVAESQEEGGGCLISTATFGSELAPQVQMLREIRDNSLLNTESGSTFMSGFNTLYYSFSPAIADLERQSPIFKEVVKVTITPLLASLSLLNYVNMDSEAEVLGFGISLILLNGAMYVAAPAIVITKIRKRF